MRPRMVAPTPPPRPSESWWLDKDRDAFYAEVRKREAEMSSTRFGKLLMLSTAAYATSEDENRFRKRREAVSA